VIGSDSAPAPPPPPLAALLRAKAPKTECSMSWIDFPSDSVNGTEETCNTHSEARNQSDVRGALTMKKKGLPAHHHDVRPSYRGIALSLPWMARRRSLHRCPIRMHRSLLQSHST